MNGYNNAIIDECTWQAVIQPKSKIIMAMLFRLPNRATFRNKFMNHRCVCKVPAFRSSPDIW